MGKTDLYFDFLEKIMKPIGSSDVGDRAETVKYFDDLDLATPFETLGDSYLEQLRAVLNYGLLYKPPVKIEIAENPEPILTAPTDEVSEPPSVFLVLEASTDALVDIDIWAKLIDPAQEEVAGFLGNNFSKYLVWGGDDRTSGKEQILVNVSDIYKDFPDMSDIKLQIRAEIVKYEDSYKTTNGLRNRREMKLKASLYQAYGYTMDGYKFSSMEKLLTEKEFKIKKEQALVLRKDAEENYSILTHTNYTDSKDADEFRGKNHYEDIPCDYVLFNVPNGRKEHKRLSLVAPFRGYDGEGGNVHNPLNTSPLSSSTIMSFYDDGVHTKGFVNMKIFQEIEPKLYSLDFVLSGYWQYFDDEEVVDDKGFTIEIEVYKGGTLEIENETPVVKGGIKILQKTIEHHSSYTPSSFHPEYDEGDIFVKFIIPINTTDPSSIQITKVENNNA